MENNSSCYIANVVFQSST